MLARKLSIIAAATGFFAVLTSLFQFQDGIATLKPELASWISFNFVFLLGAVLAVALAWIISLFIDANGFSKPFGQIASVFVFIGIAAVSSWLAYDTVWPPDSLAILFLVLLYAAREIGVAAIQGDHWFL